MKYKLPVILAMCVASQCAPFVTEVKGEDINMDAVYAEEELTCIRDGQIFNQNMLRDLEELLTSAKAYLGSDASLLVSNEIPSAASADLKKRDEVFVLETAEGYARVRDEQGNEGWIRSDLLYDTLDEIFDDVEAAMYVKENNVPVYASPDAGSEVISTLDQNDQVQETGISTASLARIEIDGSEYYVAKDALQDHAVTFADRLADIESQPVTYSWSGAILSRSAGSVTGPSGKETYYNLDMSAVVSIMRSLGFNAADYPYWVRSDGAKMLGPYIMIAADLSTHPKGTTMEISLGTGLVCDTGGFVYNGSGTKVDVATAW